ncbi:MAG: HEAT repeat domain-containing protein [Planctomycetia bacterium]|nr:HEAT repeat domain-containing protein [Planctomycetia bacterium]
MIRQPHLFSMALGMAAGCLLAAPGCSGTQAPPPAAKPVPVAAAPAVTESTKSAASAEPAEAVAEPAAAASSQDSIQDLIKRLAATTDSKARVLVIDEIGAVGQNAKPALEALLGVLADEEPRVRWHAARAIGLIGEDARSAIPAILELLSDEDPIVVTQAAAAVALIREDDGRDPIPAADAALYASAVDPLAKTLVHPDARARRAALRSLRRLSTSLEEMAPIVSKQLADADPSVVIAALQTLADMDDDAVPFLIEALKDPKSRYWAEVALAEVGPTAAPATEELAKVVGESGDEERLQAILALAAIGEKASAAAPEIAKVLVADDASSRLAAAFALGRIKAAGCDECLEKAAASDDRFLAATAAWARARIHPEDAVLVREAVDRLTKGLTDADAEVRAGCVSGLSDLAEEFDASGRERLAGEFVALLADMDPDVGRAAGAALIRLGPAAVGALQPKLDDPGIRLNIMEILAALGPAAKPALAELVKSLSDPEPEVRGEAAVAIGAIGPDAAAAVPGLQKLLTDEIVGLRYAATYALGRIGPAAVAVEPALRELTESKDEMMSTVAVWAVLKIKPEDKSLFEAAVPLLRRALRGDRENVRLEAAVALGDIGPPAASAIPLLELVSEDDPVKPVRAAAAAAIEKIKGR